MEPEAGAGRDAPAAMGEIRFAGENLSHKRSHRTHRVSREDELEEEAAHRDGSPYLGAGSGARAGRREQGREQGCSRCYGLAVAPEAAASAVARYLGNGLLRVGMSVPAHPPWGA